MSSRPARSAFRWFAGATTAMTLTLVSIGVYTAATGSGLACQAQWPLCSDQFVPSLVVNPDFIEWFHRVWAMVVGFLILGTAAWSWLGGRNRAVRVAATLAVVILPLQITVGAVTVTLNGFVPGGYAVSTHAAHLIVALTIFTLLGLATLFSGSERGARGIRRAFGLAVGLLLAAAVLSRAVPLLTYSPGAQAWFYAFALGAHLALLAATTWAFAGGRDRLAAVGAGALAALFATMLLGRDLVLYTTTWETINQGTLLVAVGAALVGYLLARGSDTSSASIEPVGGD